MLKYRAIRSDLLGFALRMLFCTLGIYACFFFVALTRTGRDALDAEGDSLMWIGLSATMYALFVGGLWNVVVLVHRLWQFRRRFSRDPIIRYYAAGAIVSSIIFLLTVVTPVLKFSFRLFTHDST